MSINETMNKLLKNEPIETNFKNVTVRLSFKHYARLKALSTPTNQSLSGLLKVLSEQAIDDGFDFYLSTLKDDDAVDVHVSVEEMIRDLSIDHQIESAG
jgi:predicted DNA-binding protein